VKNLAMQGGLQDPKPNVFKGTYIEIKSVLLNKVAAEDVKAPCNSKYIPRSFGDDSYKELFLLTNLSWRNMIISLGGRIVDFS
jgi:hypothetical protein